VKLLFSSLFLVLFVTAEAQIMQGGGGMQTGGLPGSTQPNNRNAFQDTTKKDRKPGDKFLDDSTKQIYGAYSTRFKYLSDFYEVTQNRYIVDTTLENFHRYNFVNRGANQWQDLGTVGTAIKPLFLPSPTEVGSKLGIDVFSRYLFDFETLRFFNTRSPYSEWSYAQGGSGRSVLDVHFAINSGPDLNIAAGYRSLGSKLLTGNLVQSNRDRQARHRSFYISSIWEKSRYKLLFMVSNYNHILLETGGLATDTSWQSLEELYKAPPQRLSNNLSEVRGEQKGIQANVYQQFALDSTRLQIFSYHALTNQTNLFEDNKTQSHLEFYKSTYFQNSTQSFQNTRYTCLENRIGLKTRIGAFFFATYLRNRQFQYRLLSQKTLENGLNVNPETSLGSTLSLTFKKIGRIAFDAEYLFFTDYRFKSTLDFKWFTGGYVSSLYRPALVHRHFVGNHAWWFNPLKSIFFNEVFGTAKFNFSRFGIEPSFRVLSLNNWVYFNESIEPTQLKDSENMAQVSLKIRLKTGSLQHHLELANTQTQNNSVLRLPQNFLNYQIYYFTKIKKGRMLLQVGFDNHYRSLFKADAYDPFSQQFYLQNRFEVGNFWQCDFFANAILNRSRFFIKVTNLLKDLAGKGDFSTPGYMMQQRQFEFGLCWMSFD
jgi:hypothetical protein